jgi:hypothetical protein
VVRKWYLRLSVLPPILLWFELYWLETLEGWSGWAAIGAMQTLIAISAAMGLLGIGLSLQARWTGERVTYLLLGTLLSGSGAIFIFGYWAFN